MKRILIITVLLILAFYGYKFFQPKNAMTDLTTDTSTASTFTAADLDNIPPTYNDYGDAPPAVNTSSYTCDGRMHCSQMMSCAEATYFINHCPNTKMDGNGDGVPCEQQWCQ